MIKSPLELRHLETLHALKMAGTLQRAAELLHLTPSALSHQVKILEDFYGIPLFDRKSRPLVLTRAGLRLWELARLVVPQIEEAERDVFRLAGGETGTLRIAVECHSCFDWLTPALASFRQRWPDVEIDLLPGFFPEPPALLDRDEADVVLVSERSPPGQYDEAPLFSYEIRAVLAVDHPLTAKTFLQPADLAREILLTHPVPEVKLDIFRCFLLPAGVSPQRRTNESSHVLLQLAASRRGVAALPVWTFMPFGLDPYLTDRGLGENGLRAELSALGRRGAFSKPYLAEFLKLVRATCLERLSGIQLT